MSDTGLFEDISKQDKQRGKQNKRKQNKLTKKIIGGGITKKNIIMIIIATLIIGIVVAIYMHRSAFLPAKGQQRSDLTSDKNYSIKSVFERLRAKQKAFLTKQ